MMSSPRTLLGSKKINNIGVHTVRVQDCIRYTLIDSDCVESDSYHDEEVLEDVNDSQETQAHKTSTVI